ncbi:MAG: hypothetical protein K2U26_01995, partial [Cyclobacteriaceae bacterium]|nr:hypothetical protein [Cyclobacteriaceae bacterium]
WKFLLSDQVFSVLNVLLLSYFIGRSQRIFYQQKWYWSVLKTMIILAGIQVSIELYRRALFYFTMWWM